MSDIVKKNMSQPKVSIILVNWNGREDTANCLKSLKKLDYSNYEIIVVDNGSTDNSQNYLKTIFPNIILIENIKNEGFGKANNIGMRWCLNNSDATYFFIINNDTKIRKDTLSQLIRTAASASNIGIVTPKIYFMDSENIVWFAGGYFDVKRGSARVIGVHELDKGQYDIPTEITFATGCAMLIKKSVIENIGMFDERYFVYEEDVEFSLRVIKYGYKIFYEPNAIVYHRVNASIRKSDVFSGILSPKNSRACFYYYYLVRNRLFTMKKHANIFRWIIFLPYFLFYWSIKCSQSAIVGNYKAMGGIAKGIKDFFLSISGAEIK